MSFITLLQTNSVFFISLCTTIGLVAGSFLNVIIFRLPKMMEREWNQQCSELRGETTKPLPTLNLVKPCSECPHCKHKITALESIPIISYLALRGRCSQCNTSISLRYPIMEALTGIMSGFIAWHFGYGFITVAALIFVWSMIALAFIDLDTQLLPDEVTLPLLWIGLLINLGNGFTDISSAVIGAASGYIFLWLIYWCFKIATGKEGMGYGDFKLLAVIGAWFGWKMLPLVILLSSLAGAVIGIGLIIVAKNKRDTPFPFGPYLVGGGLVALFWGDQLNRTYLDLL
ncbi:MAG: A24 family peptidase [Nitrosomonadaceae bacterium]|nr:A24 family peptidase [Nitrosomonadaceae bacterium]